MSSDYKPTLLIIAAGMGSRYGGLKQIDPVGPNGEIIIDYSIYDAIEAGFKKIVFVIRHYFEDAFRDKISRKLESLVEIVYAYQELDSCLEGFTLPAGREKPWGTGHAILTAKDVIKEPFAVINADDYYGKQAYSLMKGQLESMAEHDGDYAMIGYLLRNTLSEYGSVARGVCHVGRDGYLLDVTERTSIRPQNGKAQYTDSDGTVHSLSGDEVVSMNMWGFGSDMFEHLRLQFNEYLCLHAKENKSEFYIPSAVDRLIKNNLKKVKVLQTSDTWFGVTYKEDKPIAQAKIRQMIEQGIYPMHLWNGRNF